ncbi:hypothetical protein AB6A40_003744 [Gnathostoma spinigerum]|uniref:NF-kappa-B inhibitor-interacting Ras-like protein n=1 Tax=Gnathostoma spinigerum TaxID=75299 RepID=A0ABD6EBL1_9BILA
MHRKNEKRYSLADALFNVPVIKKDTSALSGATNQRGGRRGTTALLSPGGGGAGIPIPSNGRESRRASLTQLVFGVPPSYHGSSSQPPFTEWSKSEDDASNSEDFLNSKEIPEVDSLPTSAVYDRRGSVSAAVFGALTGTSSSSTYARLMGRVMRVVVLGPKKVGKTACLQQLACVNDITGEDYNPTVDDTYQVQMDYGDRPKEIMIFHDTAGISNYGPIELKRPYIQVADAFLLVYSVTDHESFNRMDALKSFIEKQFGKDKKEVPIVVLGNMTDLPGRKVDTAFAQNWASREKVKLYEVTATDRNTLLDLVIYLGSRYFHSQKESKFSLSKKLKPEKSNAAILMDF